MIGRLFDQVAARAPDATAIVTATGQWSYRELRDRADAVARPLDPAASGGVGLLFEHGAEMIAAALGAAKAGCRWVPLDPKYPDRRIDAIADDAEISFLLADRANREGATRSAERARSRTGRQIVLLDFDEVTSDATLKGERAPDRAVPDDAIAYILYTSGSTGLPKGVVQNHRNVCHFARVYGRRLGLLPSDRLTLISAFHHDAAIVDMFGALLAGAALAPFDIRGEAQSRDLKDWLASERITVYHSVPTLFRYLLGTLRDQDRFPDLRWIVLGGEAVLDHDVRAHRRFFGAPDGAKLVNLYGQSESSIDSIAVIGAEGEPGRPTLGEPIDGVELMVVDEEGAEVAPLESGEIVVASEHVAVGYWRDPERTGAVFVDEPELGRLYFTGDLGRLLLDGRIEFLGRRDQQVKIRGFRVDLNEVESRLLAHPAVREAAVVPRRDSDGSQYLQAFYATRAGDEASIPGSAFRELLAADLPDYMIPSDFVGLDALPVTATKKVDRKALEALDRGGKRHHLFSAPRTEAERKLARIWSEVLGEPSIGVDDDFFELGGHSLKAVAVVSRIHREFGVECPLRELFDHPTVARLAERIEAGRHQVYASIPVAEERPFYPLSSAQRRLFIFEQLGGVGTAYNMPGALLVEGALDIDRLERAVRALIARHEALRTSFATVDGEPVQRVHAEVAFEIERIEAGASTEIDRLVADFVRPFDLGAAPLLRIGLIRIDEERHLLAFDIHHIVSDGTSMGVLVRELVALYGGESLPPLRIQYKDYSAWQAKLFGSELFRSETAHWLEALSGEIPVLSLPTDRPRPALQSFEGETVELPIDGITTSKLEALAAERGVTLYMLLLAAWQVLLSKWSGQEDLIVGSPVSGRPHADLEGILGMFVNTLVLRGRPAGTKRFVDFLDEIRATSLTAFENQDTPFEELVERVDVRRDLGRNPLFDVVFAFQNVDIPDLEIPGLRLTPWESRRGVSKFDLTLNVVRSEGRLEGFVEFATALWNRSTIERMVAQLVRLFADVVEHPDRPIAALRMLSPEEERRVVFDFNATTTDYPRDRSIAEIFEEVVAGNPDRLAVVDGTAEISYGELNRRANALAWQLRSEGVGREEIVGIMADRSVGMLVAILGILKAGGAYLPIDPDFPDERAAWMLSDAGARFLLVDETARSPRPTATKGSWNGRTIDLASCREAAGHDSDSDPLSNGDSLAYVMYTSGSTGRPKGVLVEQRSVVRLVRNTNYVRFDPDDRILPTGALGFDASTFEIWGALLNGLALVLVAKSAILDPTPLGALLDRHRITILWLTSPLFNQLAEAEPSIFRPLRQLLVGGDVLSPHHIRRVRAACPAIRIVNGYGPTENTTFSTCHPIDRDDGAIPIGKPIANSRAYVLDRMGAPQPIGVPGELCVAGEGVARGYLGRPELSAERFLSDPFVPGERMYRTGDQARWLEDGTIEFLGRIDDQVKIRGFRIELGEIEAAILEHEAVREAVVVVRSDPSGGKSLAAYCVFDSESATRPELRTFLARRLPDYMIPSCFVPMERLPLTPNGKVDRRALPDPELQGTERAYEAPRTEIEATIAKLFGSILGVERVGIADDFFALGGHSLKATILVSRIHKELGVACPLREVFEHPTVAGLAERIEAGRRSVYASIPIVEERPFYPLSSAQKRLYVIEQLGGIGTAYNMPGALLVEGALDADRLEGAVRGLIARHEALRTSFTTVDGEPVQRVHDEVPFEIERIEGGANADVDRLVEAFVRPFDLAVAPLLRVGLIRLSDERSVLAFDLHHIVSDGTSMGILVRELMTLYRGAPLPPLRIQYKDYSAWQAELFVSELYRNETLYWLGTLGGEIPVLSLPTDRPRPALQSFDGDTVDLQIDERLSARLEALARERGVTPYMLFLAAWQALLSKWSGQEDLIVGSPIAGRPHADLEGILGMFVNTLALRGRPVGTKPFVEFLDEMKAASLGAFENADTPFEELVERVVLRRDLGRNPLFDVMFSFQNVDIPDLEISGLQLRPLESRRGISKFDLTLTVVRSDACFEGTIEFATALWNRSTIERMADGFGRLLAEIAEHPDRPIATLRMLSADEERRVVFDFNATATDYPRSRSIPELFEEVVAEEPDRIAIVDGTASVSYGELNRRANALAWQLRSEGVGREEIVGLMVDRSVGMLVGILGILKAGGAYLPIDPDFPADRVAYMLSDAESRLLLVDEAARPSRPATAEGGWSGRVIDLASCIEAAGRDSNPEPRSAGDSLAYVMYTSGSTGRPKGNLTLHRNIVRVVRNTNYVDVTPSDSLLQLSSFAFDGSTFDIFGALLNGARLVLIRKPDFLDISRLASVLSGQRISIFFVTTALFNAIVDVDLPALRSVGKVLFGGERVSVDHARRAVRALGPGRVVHVYGPTETTVFATAHPIGEIADSASTVPIGAPIANTRAYVLDRMGAPQPIGVPGELCVAGEGVARGYLGRPELSAERFLSDPFVPGERMYRTGDQARWLEDGTIEFLGRIDDQVKIRGFRIELGEIEAAILEHGAVREAVVVVRSDPSGGKSLAAYCVFDSESATRPELRTFLARRLPDYMIPSCFVPMERLPLTPNGKVDRRALPDPESSGADRLYEAPRTEVEATLAKLFGSILGVERVGIADDFFALGGHSLKATLLVSRIHKELGVACPLREVFEHPTVAGLAGRIEAGRHRVYASIPIAEERPFYPLSSAQKRLYVIEQMGGTVTAYNMPGALLVEGALDADRLEGAVRALIARHEALRTSFMTVDGEPVQRVHAEVPFEIERIAAEASAEIDRLVADFVRPFDLAVAPLLRVGLIRLSDERSVLVFDLHHIVSDGTSMGILVRELMALYRGQALPPLRIQYKDYSAWQAGVFASELFQKETAYWLEALSGEIPVLSLPTDRPRPALQRFEGESVDLEIGADLTARLEALAAARGVTLFMLLLAAWQVLLSKWSGQEDLIVGSPIAGRPHADLEGILGMFVNTLALRGRPVGAKPFVDFLDEVKATSLGAFENQDYPFEELVERVALRRDLGRNPLFDVMFAFQNVDIPDLKIPGLRLEPVGSRRGISKFDLTLNVAPSEGGLDGSIEFATALFGRSTVVRLADHFAVLLRSIVDRPDAPIESLAIMTDEERRLVGGGFSSRRIPLPADETIPSMFERQVARDPDRIAVAFEDETLTYRELATRADRLAVQLRALGALPESIVAICIDRSLDMIVGLCGIAKSGAAFLPIDPDYPPERIRFQLADSGASILVAPRSIAERIGFSGTLLPIDEPGAIESKSGPIGIVSRPEQLAYVIYTSGSTGRPKGVLVEHRNLVAYVLGRLDVIPVFPDDRILEQHSFSFDGFLEGLYAALLTGATFVLPNRREAQDARLCAELIRRRGVSAMTTSPLFLNELNALPPLETLRTILSGGDILRPEQISELANRATVHNVYGPTEATIVATIHRCEPPLRAPIPIGRPVPNYEILIVDPSGRFLPIGVPGEIWISGAGVARGYLGRPELTRERFVPHPAAPERRAYRTGDLGRWHPDGTVEFLGRSDEQVKIRGFRVELGEIESALLAIDGIGDCAVVAAEQEGGEKELRAYLVPDSGDATGAGRLTVATIRERLALSLAQHMIPNRFVTVDRLPHTPHGKLDRKRLAEMGTALSLGTTHEAPRTEVEAAIARLFGSILGVERVGIDDDFFALGGHSLKATILVSRIHKELGVACPLREVFEHPTVAGLAERIEAGRRSVYASIPIAEKRPFYPLSSAQKRLYVIEQMGGTGTAYNMPGALLVEGPLDVPRLEGAVRGLIARHEALRTSFATVDGEPVQRVHSEVPFEIERIEGGASADVDRLVEAFVRPFDLAVAPLLRVGLIRLSDERSVLAFDLHHIVSDGTSMGILVRELMALYRGAPLPPLRLQYKDYSAWQAGVFASELFRKETAYWLEALSGEIPVLSLPTDRARPALQRFEGETVDLEIGTDLTARLEALAAERGITLFMLLLAAWQVLLSKWSGQEEVIVGSPIAGRPHADLEGILGMFVNTLALRGRPVGTKPFVDFLDETRAASLGAFENQDYPFEELVERVALRRDLGRNPLFDAMFAFQNVDIPDLEIPGLVIRPLRRRSGVSKFDLTLDLSETDGILAGSVEFATGLFDRSTVLRLAGHFAVLLRSIVDRPDAPIESLAIMTEEERRLVEGGFSSRRIPLPAGETIPSMFERQVARDPDRIAVAFEDETLTYRELALQADRLAARLRAMGALPESIVAICIDRSLDMIVGLCGIAKSGAAFLPIDPDDPPERVRFLLADSGASILVAPRSIAERIGFPGTLLPIDELDTTESMSEPIAIVSRPEQLAYVIYTSGSTGRPKGVLVEHRNLVAYIHAFLDAAPLAPDDRVLEHHSFSFDAFLEGLYASLFTGATFVLPNRSEARDVGPFAELVLRRQTTVVMTSPLFLNELDALPPLDSVRAVVCGGDVLHPEYVSKIAKRTTIYNNYGPTEATIAATIHRCELPLPAPIPIGRPVANYEVSIVDGSGRPVPIGVPGEIRISGPGVARGYLGRPELTRERFVPHPELPGQRVYRTGDLGRWRPDGAIEFLGRSDEQVKIRGFRIELGEIESALLAIDGIRECAVVATEREGEGKELRAYLVAAGDDGAGDGRLTVATLRERLALSLPEQMIPSRFVTVERLPRSTHGKLDRRRLAEMGTALSLGTTHESPRNEVEARLAEAFGEVLGVERVGIHDDFFALGGDSMKAMRLVARLAREFDLTLATVFAAPSVAAMATTVRFRPDNLRRMIAEVVEAPPVVFEPSPADRVALEAAEAEYEREVASVATLDLEERSRSRDILLTGATGYLGLHLLRDLLETTEARLHLLVRPRDDREARERLERLLEEGFDRPLPAADRERISIVPGDLEREAFGLTTDRFQALAEGVDAVVHSAANVRHYGAWDDFVRPNVLGTERLLAFATLGRPKAFHYVSTMSLGGLGAASSVPSLFTERDRPRPIETPSVYLRSKLLAEEAVERARREGLEASILRVGNLVFERGTGRFQKNIGENAFYTITRALLKVGAIPAIEGDSIDLTYIDSASRAVALLVGRAAVGGSNHHVANASFGFGTFGELLRAAGAPVEILPIERFLELLLGRYDDPAVAPFVRDLLIHLHPKRPEGEGSALPIRVRSDRTDALLGRLGFRWEPPSAAHVARMLDHGREVGFF